MARHLFVTGATGYIARHIVDQALSAGHRVTGSTRDMARGAAYRQDLAARLGPEAAARFALVPLDLTLDTGWPEAMAGAEAVLHTASPVPFGVPRTADALVEAAVGGTRRVLTAAHQAGIRRIVLTSSSSAIMGAAPPPDGVFDESCWTDPEAPGTGPYPRSKTLAERAAWEIADAQGQTLTSVNPTVVVGPPHAPIYSASIKVFARLLKGRDPFLPRTGMTLIDVRDVAAAHLAALDRPDTEGQRLFLHERFLWAKEIAAILRRACPGTRVATREAPDLVFRALGLIDRKIATIVPNLGQRPKVRNDRTRAALGIAFRDTRASVAETAELLWRNGWLD